LRIEPADVLALECKPSVDGKAWIVRLFGASGEDRRAKLTWAGDAAPRMWRSNLSEQPLEPAGQEVAVAGWDLVTLRIDRSER
jgi:hypothetical protein